MTVAGGDVAPWRVRPPSSGRPLGIRASPRTVPRFTGRRGSAAQAVGQFAQAPLAAVARPSASRVGPDDQVGRPLRVVDDRHLLGQQQLQVGRADAAGLFTFASRGSMCAPCRSRSSPPGPPQKRGSPAATAGFSRSCQRSTNSSGLPSTRSTRRRRSPLRTRGRWRSSDARRQADERIAAESFAADHAFQQEAVALAAASFRVQRQRRLQVGERLGDEQGYGCGLARQGS